VDRRGIGGSNHPEVVWSGVSAVPVKGEGGEAEMVFLHQEIAEDFGEDGGGADFGVGAVAAGDTYDGREAGNQRQWTVHEDGGRERTQGSDGESGGARGRWKNADAVNETMADGDDSEGGGVAYDDGGKRDTLIRRERFGIGEPKGRRLEEEDGGDNDGSRERSATGFVDAGDRVH
jgi:hypothetical protein